MNNEDTERHDRPIDDSTRQIPTEDLKGGKPRRGFVRALVRSPLVLVDLFMLVMFVYLGARLLTGNMWAPVELFAIILPYVMLLTLPLLFLALAYRAWIRVVWMSVLTVLFVWWYGILFIPDPPVRCEGNCTELVVLQYNTGTDTTGREQLEALLQIANADIVALEELGSVPASVMEASDYQYSVFFDGRGTRDLGLYSRYPIIDEQLIFDPATQFPLAIDAVLDVDGKRLHVIVAHPARPRRVGEFEYHVPARDDIPVIAAEAANGGPTLVIGDMNTTSQTVEYATLQRAGLRDSWVEAGLGFGATFPSAEERYRGLPVEALIRIDYVLHTSEFRARSADVGPDAGSDHLPLIVTLVWN